MSKKILVVDDEPALARILEVNLTRAGYEVVTAGDGRDALTTVERENPDLVLMDVMMPFMDGFEALRLLKEDPKTADLPVVMLTARAHRTDLQEGLERGADMYVTKPVNPQELLGLIERLFADRDMRAAEPADQPE